jgi:hypothetical protein
MLLRKVKVLLSFGKTDIKNGNKNEEYQRIGELSYY